jgi:hypothetical protein
MSSRVEISKSPTPLLAKDQRVAVPRISIPPELAQDMMLSFAQLSRILREKDLPKLRSQKVHRPQSRTGSKEKEASDGKSSGSSSESASPRTGISTDSTTPSPRMISPGTSPTTSDQALELRQRLISVRDRALSNGQNSGFSANPSKSSDRPSTAPNKDRKA